MKIWLDVVGYSMMEIVNILNMFLIFISIKNRYTIEIKTILA